jgi:uncharacterized protein (TIGR03435 family)
MLQTMLAERFKLVCHRETREYQYVYPVFSGGGKGRPKNSMYRAYRVPYAWIPQLARPVEQAVTPPKVEEFRVK